MTPRFTPVALTLLALSACAPPEPPPPEPPSFSDEPLAGVVGGAPWTFVAGDTDAFLSDEESVFTVFSNVAFATCVDNASPPELLTSLPRAPGVTRLGLGTGVTVTFSPSAGENLVAIVGAVRIDEVTDTAIEGALKANFDSDNKVDGVFTITLCPP